MAGPLKRYNVGGMDLGDGRPAPADTVLKLDRATAERMGLVKPSRKASDDESSTPAPPTPDVVTKPRKASTRKRTAAPRR